MAWQFIVPAVAGLIGAKMSSDTANRAYKKNVAAARAAEDRAAERASLVGLRKDAEAAGFNPLSALRYGGRPTPFVGQVPMLSGHSFYADAVRNIGNIAGKAINHYSSYNVEQRKLNTALKKAELSHLNKLAAPVKAAVDVYGDMKDVPVQYLLKKFTLPVDMAKRLRIPPNANLSAGEMAEIMGEGVEGINLFAHDGQVATFGIGLLELAGGDPANAWIKSNEQQSEEIKKTSGPMKFSLAQEAEISMPVLSHLKPEDYKGMGFSDAAIQKVYQPPNKRKGPSGL